MTAFSVNYASWVPAAEGFVEKSDPPVTWSDGAVTSHTWVELKGSLEVTIGGVTRRIEGSMTESAWITDVWEFHVTSDYDLELDETVFVPHPIYDLFSEGAYLQVSGELSADGSTFTQVTECEFEEPIGAFIEPLAEGSWSGSQLGPGYFEGDYPALFRALRWA